MGTEGGGEEETGRMRPKERVWKEKGAGERGDIGRMGDKERESMERER